MFISLGSISAMETMNAWEILAIHQPHRSGYS